MIKAETIEINHNARYRHHNRCHRPPRPRLRGPPPRHLPRAHPCGDSQGHSDTANLKRILSKYPNAKPQLEQVDLAYLSSVRSFTACIVSAVSTGPPWASLPLSAMLLPSLCYLSHHFIVLCLLGSMEAKSGRVVMLGSVAPDKGNLNLL